MNLKFLVWKNQSLEKISYEKPKVLKKIQVLIPIPENSVEKCDNFKIYGIKKTPEVKIVEKIIEKNLEREVVPNRIRKNDRFRIYGIKKEPEVKIVEKIIEKNIEREVIPNKISKNDRFRIYGIKKAPEVKIVEKIIEKNVERVIEPNKINKNDRFRIYGIKKEPEVKIVERVIDNAKVKEIVPNQIGKNERFRIYGKEKKIVPNKIMKNDRFRIIGIRKEQPIKVIEKVEEKIIEKKLTPNKISNLDKFIIKGKQQKVIKFRIEKPERFIIEGFEKEEEEPEENIEESVVEISILTKPKKILPNIIKKLERFNITGIEQPKEEFVPVKRKGFVEKIKKNVITKKEEKKEESIEKKEEYYPESLESVIITRAYSRPKPSGEIIKEFNNLNVGKSSVVTIFGVPKKVEEVVIEQKEEIDWNKIIRSSKGPNIILRNSYRKVPTNQQQIIQREEILVYKNWNDDNKIIKSTKLVVKGTKKVWDYLEENQEQFKLIAKNKKQKIVQKEEIKEVLIEKEKEEFDIESFSFNIVDSGRKFRESLNIESSGFDLEGYKGMILKEGPAQTIQIKKEQILIPSKILEFSLNKIEKPKIELQSNTENRLFIRGIEQKIIQNIEQVQVETTKTINWNDFNLISKQGDFKLIHKQKQKEVEIREKIVEKIVEVNKNIDWNQFNKIEKKAFNLLNKKKVVTLAKQRANSIGLIGTGKVETVKVVHKVEKKDWTNIQAQRNAKFTLLGKQKTKKYKLLVANGDKFFIMKESDDEIIYNDDYNSRKDIKKLKNENEGDKKKTILKEKEVIREKEFVPRKKREIRAQISRLKESESESSSISEIDVLASIRNKKMIKLAQAQGKGKGEIDTTLLQFKKNGELNGYQTKVINGEVIFTTKNGLGVNLGGTQYQKQISAKAGYTKKFSNKMSGIEIINPKVKSEIYFQKLTGSKGAIEDGNYQIIGTEFMNKGLSGSISCRQMQILKKNDGDEDIPESDMAINGSQQSYRKKIVITTKTENNQQNEINGQPNTNITNVILNNSRIKESKNSLNSYLRKKDSQNSGSDKAQISNSPISANNMNIHQQMNLGKVIFNSRLKSDSNQNSPISAGAIMGNKTNSTRKEYEMRIKTSSDGNEKIITESKKTTEVRFKNKKTKNVEPLRDYDSQNSF